MTFCIDMHCGKNPKNCPHAIVDEDGDSWLDGLPIRFYRPGKDCPEVIQSRLEDQIDADYERAREEE